MDKTKIKKFAIWAREKLIADITYKAGMLGITDSGIAAELPQSTANLKFFDIGTKDYAEVQGQEIQQRNALVKAIREKENDCGKYKDAFEFVVEEVAYTWFNRLAAIRFMEVNDYLPSGIRVLSSENPAKAEPDFVTTPFDTDLEFTPYEQDHIIELKDQNKLDELFRLLFIKQCNKLHDILPALFENTNDYSEILLSISFTDKDGVVYRLTHDIDEDDFNVAKEGQVEIIGWLYQYYNSVPKDTVFANLKKNQKIRKEDIPAATQLFTPDWIVRYMVENSLGRLWIEGHPNQTLREGWKYYLDEAQQEEAVEKQLAEIRKGYAAMSPEDIKIIDPCMGSGHILVYAFDVLMQIYDSMGYTARDAVRSIVENNIYGLDIDNRAAQLAYFAMMMKARRYDRRFFSRGISPNVYSIRESNHLDINAIDYFCNDDQKLTNAMQTIKEELYDATEYGSILTLSNQNWEALYQRFDEVHDDISSIYREMVLTELLPLVQVAEALAQKYDTVVTNPPYMGSGGMGTSLSNYIKKHYPNSKADLFAVFIEKWNKSISNNGYNCMVTMQSWMFLSSFEKMRRCIIETKTITNLMHMDNMVMGIAFGTAVSIFRNSSMRMYKGTYNHIMLNDIQDGKPFEFPVLKNRYSQVNVDCFSKLPGAPIAYWAPNSMVSLFDHETISNRYCSGGRNKTHNDEKYLRMIWEVQRSPHWSLYAKGGAYRKWYGDIEYLVNWSETARNEYLKHGGLINKSFWNREGITWTIVTAYKASFRIKQCPVVYSSVSPTIFNEQKQSNYYELAFLNSKVSETLLDIINPTLATNVGDILGLPIINGEEEKVCFIANENIAISTLDWNSFETSWDFICDPLVKNSTDLWDCTAIGATMSYYYHGILPEASCPMEICYLLWKGECEDRFQKLKANEEELNRIFIDIYGLQNELTPEVEDKDVTVYRVFDRKEDIPESMGSSRYALTKQDVVKNFISYAVGCMFGRYSLDADGLAYAGGEWDDHKYKSFIPDADNCIPITDEEYFDDDIVGRFVKFVEVVYGRDSLEDNLTFIANALGNKGKTSREVIRNYFLSDFIKDHIKKYQKRPIYWLFDSGKQNGFKALVYMHRWNEDTVGNLRVEYLHKMQRVYEKEIERMQETIDNSRDNKEITAANKRKEKLQKQLKETKDYDAKIAHIALSRIGIDLDDGVKVNYEKVQTVDGKNMGILAKI